jgi:hypothetical protein
MKLLAFGLAAGLLVAGGLALPLAGAPEPVRVREPGLVDTLVLLRWGHGALDWLLPDSQGELHVRTKRD